MNESNVKFSQEIREIVLPQINGSFFLQQVQFRSLEVSLSQQLLIVFEL